MEMRYFKEELETEPADFETAIAATKFGKFNIILYFGCMTATWSVVYENMGMSYVFPAAQCDLNLTLDNKGLLNAITIAGMVSSGFIWGFLCDIFGRKKLLIIGYLLDAVFVILSSFSQNFLFLLITKFFGGFIITGPFSALISYLSEFHGVKYRPRIELLRGFTMCCGQMSLPLLAWVIFPLDINLHIFDGYIVLHSWNILLLTSSIFPLFSGIFFIFMPESPKYLMTEGRMDDALNVFKLLYSLNTGDDKDNYTIRHLKRDTVFDNDSKKVNMKLFKTRLYQLKLICSHPYVKNFILICFLQTLLSINTLKNWFPQIFQAISDYEYYNNDTSNFCTILESIEPSNGNVTCEYNFSSSVYSSSMIIIGTSAIGFIFAGTIVKKIGRLRILNTVSFLSGLCAISVYYSENTEILLAICCMLFMLSGICFNLSMSFVVNLFPTTSRAMTVALVMTLGRLSAVIGNVLFPTLLRMGCGVPFFFIGFLILVASALSFLLPNIDKKSLA